MSNRDPLHEDAERWLKLCEMVEEGMATVTFMGRLATINTGLEVCSAGDLHDEINDELRKNK